MVLGICITANESKKIANLWGNGQNLSCNVYALYLEEYERQVDLQTGGHFISAIALSPLTPCLCTSYAKFVLPQYMTVV